MAQDLTWHRSSGTGRRKGTQKSKRNKTDKPFMLAGVLESETFSPSSSCFMADRSSSGSPDVRFGVEADIWAEPDNWVDIKLSRGGVI
jgi:hypothetical protein